MPYNRQGGQGEMNGQDAGKMGKMQSTEEMSLFLHYL
jgi:hypothetical protein